MKNKLLIGLGTCLSLLLSGCAIYFNGTQMPAYKDADKYVAGSQNYEENINTLNLNWISGKVTLYEDDTITGVQIEEDCSFSNPDGQVHSYLHDGILDIQFMKSEYKTPTSTFVKYLIVTYNPTLDNLNVNLTSGTFRADHLTATDTININYTSGMAEFSNVNCKKLNINFISGELTSSVINAEEITITATSGEIYMDAINTKKIKSSSTTGRHRLKFLSVEEGNVSITSGALVILLPDEGGTVNVSNIKGTIMLFRDCEQDGDTYKFGEGTAIIDVSIISGSFEVY